MLFKKVSNEDKLSYTRYTIFKQLRKLPVKGLVSFWYDWLFFAEKEENDSSISSTSNLDSAGSFLVVVAESWCTVEGIFGVAVLVTEREAGLADTVVSATLVYAADELPK